MRAIVISAQSSGLQDAGLPWGELSPLVDRPFSQHVIESIVDQGVRRIDFLVQTVFEGVTRKTLGDGTRWGARITYHSCRSGAPVYSALSAVRGNDPSENILLAHADRLPLIALGAVAPATQICWRHEDLMWSGWSMVHCAALEALADCVTEEEVFGILSGAKNAAFAEGPRPLTARSHRDLIEANRRVLSGEFPGLLFGGREVRPGVWLGRNVNLHPTAKLIAPAFVGENCRVGPMAQIGPSASIGRDCMIERDTLISDSVVCRGSYVGQQLALKGVVVDRSRLVNTRWAAEIEGVDELLIGSVAGPPLGERLRRISTRLMAVLALAISFPCLLVMWLGAALGIIPGLTRKLVVRTPTVSPAYRWSEFPLWSFGIPQTPGGSAGWLQHFFLCFLPALFAVAAGHMSFAGTRPRAKEEVERMPLSKRSAYLRSRSGILQRGVLQTPDPDGDLFNGGAAGTDLREASSLVAQYAGIVLKSGFFGIFHYRAGGTWNEL